jgi:SWI/SNF-related matrix-associated actin-dependent regulator 1 of chromatin subfamily A
MLRSQLADSTEKVVVFAHHRNVLAALRETLASYGVVVIDGDVTERGRDAAIDRFQHDEKTRVFLGQNVACMTGMDGLQQVAHRALLVEPDWTAVNNVQLGKRVARIGQHAGRAIVQMVALAGTLDEAIVAQNLRETRMAAAVRGVDGQA